MIKTFESFEDLADVMCDGEGILHLYNCAYKHRDAPEHPCLLWQSGVRTFAEWLDHIGVKVEIPDSAKDFYEFCAKRAFR